MLPLQLLVQIGHAGLQLPGARLRRLRPAAASASGKSGAVFLDAIQHTADPPGMWRYISRFEIVWREASTATVMRQVGTLRNVCNTNRLQY